MDARTAAANILDLVLVEGKTLDLALATILEQVEEKRDRAFAQELCYGVLRNHDEQNYILDQLLDRPIKENDRILRSVMHCGLYQLDHMRTPPHAAVSASVETAKHLGKPWAKGLINAVLRRYQREKDILKANINQTEQYLYSHPQWLINKLKNNWPEDWKEILIANNTHAPMHLRLNTNVISRDEYLIRLKESGIEATCNDVCEFGITLSTATDVENLPGFSEGLVSIQDIGAQLAARLLDLQPGQRVLDACAAPGGKAAHIHQCQPDIDELVAVESEEKRLALLDETKLRLGIDFKIVHGSACATDKWWDGKLFDRILVDAPCSAIGVIRRHPDIKYIRKPSDMDSICKTQYDILSSLWPLLKQEGKLVYVTCSVLNDENDMQIQRFISEFPDATVSRIETSWGTASEYGRQILPGQDAMDGFYYAVISKQ
jgi:16S rRNA (cytosine967-C5)-methyltransferase